MAGEWVDGIFKLFEPHMSKMIGTIDFNNELGDKTILSYQARIFSKNYLKLTFQIWYRNIRNNFEIILIEILEI